MPLPRAVARLNKRFTNQFIEPVVARLPGYAVIEHIGRRSGAGYCTPVYRFAESAGTYLVALTYGPSADWVQNVLAGGGAIRTEGTSEPIAEIAIVGRADAWTCLPHVVRVALRVLRVTDFARIRVR